MKLKSESVSLNICINFKVNISMWDAIKLRIMGCNKKTWDKAFKKSFKESK